MPHAMPSLPSPQSPANPCSRAVVGRACVKARWCLCDTMSVFVGGKRLCDIVIWIVAVMLVPLLVEIHDAMRPTCGSPWKTAQKDLATLMQVIEMYKLQHDHAPESCEQLRAADLVQKCTLDPWGTEYQLLVADDGKHVTVSSAGPDEEHGTLDDMSSDSLE